MVWQYVDDLGRKVIGVFTYTLNVLLMIYLSVRAAAVDQAQGFRTILRVISAQIYFTGWQALPLISVLAVASGGIVILQSSIQMSYLGGTEMIGQLMVAIIFRELGPLITALIVIARSGTAVASEIGNMRVNREISALKVMGIDPLSFIVFPRLMGGVISVLCLAFYFNLIAIIGGFLFTRFLHGLPFQFYASSISQALTVEDIWLFLFKVSFGGAIIFVVCCYQGLLVKNSPHEVPQVTTKAVVNSVIYVISFNLAMTVFFYLNQLSKLGVL